jgi:hypothetical protein
MRALFIGAAVNPAPSPSITSEQKFKYLGKNTGNLLIGQSLREELDIEEYAYGMSIPPEEVNDRFDVIVIPAANFIYRGFDFGHLADYIAKTNLPVVMVGIGAQAPGAGSSRLEGIPSGTIRLLKIASERSKFIGVRGLYTADVVSGFGISNLVPVGCPSLYRLRDPHLSIETAGYVTRSQISLNGSRNVYEHSFNPQEAKATEASVLRYSIEFGVPYVLQNEQPELTISADGFASDEDRQALATLSSRLSLNITAQQYEKSVLSHFHVFFTIEDWDAYIVKFKLSVGSRFHGNVIAITNRVPAVVVTHDSRTRELCDLFSIPQVATDHFKGIDSIIREGPDYSGFNRKYKILYAAYAEFLSANGLKHYLRDPGP